jgi:hypothetical protein
MQRIITEFWEDETFKARLLADPVTTLKAEACAPSCSPRLPRLRRPTQSSPGSRQRAGAVGQRGGLRE